MPKQLVLACHITGVYDVNRSTTLANDDFSIVKEWAQSVTDLNLNGVIFHNNFSEQTCKIFQSENITFVKISHSNTFNPNVYRYFLYLDFLNKHAHEINDLFLTDIADVVLLKNPFEQQLYTQNRNSIFCGDEPKILHNEWMIAHAAHLRSKITDYAKYEDEFKTSTLLNCGIIGGSFKVMYSFLQKLCLIHQNYNADNKTAYTGDMGVFNYLIRTQYNEVLLHGQPINTVFKAYDVENDTCWFRHK